MRVPLRYIGLTLLFLALAELAATAVSAQAGLILSFSPSTPTVTANVNNQGSITIAVQAAADTGTQTLKGYDLFVDLQPAGIGKPAGWTVTTPVEVENFDLFSPSTTPTQGDVGASGLQLFSPAVTLTTTPITLWTFGVNFNGDAGAANGTYAMTFITSEESNFGAVDSSGNDISPVITNNGSITLQGFVTTPEPTSLALSAVFGLGWTGYLVVKRQFKKGRPAAATT